jgi:hypothetical protein
VCSSDLVILVCCATSLLANLLTGCATTQKDPAAAWPTRSDALTQDSNPQLDGMWAFLQYPIFIGSQFLGGH